MNGRTIPPTLPALGGRRARPVRDCKTTPVDKGSKLRTLKRRLRGVEQRGDVVVRDVELREHRGRRGPARREERVQRRALEAEALDVAGLLATSPTAGGAGGGGAVGATSAAAGGSRGASKSTSVRRTYLTPLTTSHPAWKRPCSKSTTLPTRGATAAGLDDGAAASRNAVSPPSKPSVK